MQTQLVRASVTKIYVINSRLLRLGAWWRISKRFPTMSSQRKASPFCWATVPIHRYKTCQEMHFKSDIQTLSELMWNTPWRQGLSRGGELRGTDDKTLSPSGGLQNG